MCIQFVYINNEAGEGEWQLIVANNRDELYTRPTKPAAFWEDNTSCISGIDLEQGREGGTWIGINTDSGKCATLLNILTNYAQHTYKLGRGNLVTDFLRSPESASTYLSSIEAHAPQYNPFNLCLLEYRNNEWHSSYYTNKDDKPPVSLDQSRYGISNSVIYKPWQKVLYGQEIFGNIVDKYTKTEQVDHLQKELLDLMNDSSSHLPDAQLESQAVDYLDETLLTQRSCIYVDSHHIKYGTRTNTLIMVDSQGRGKYTERTMVEPVVDLSHPQWSTNTIQFTMTSSPDTAAL